MRPTVAISTDFLQAYATIPKAQQKKVMGFVTKFRNDPFSSGINYERINDARDANFRSVRIDQDYRGIVLSPEKGDVYVLLWVDKHDDAYAWARRHTCGVHPETGSLQLFEADSEVLTPERVPAVEVAQPPLFSLRERELLRIGVPHDRLERVKEVRTEEELERLETLLPKEAFEALYLIAAGSDPQEIIQEYAAKAEAVDTEDFATALTREQSQRSFHVVENDQELEAMLVAPLEKWRVFLHPSQRRLVHWRVNGPIRVLGGAGTGKTVVAMHRARWLVRHALSAPDRKVLFTTFTANLATDIAENLRKICSLEELERIEVVHIDAWVSRFLKRQNYPHQIVYDGNPQYEACWRTALDARPADPPLPESFYREEWDRVILPQRITDRAQYFRAKRVGRGVPLTRAQRAALWGVFEELRIQLHQRGLKCSEDATQDAADLLASGKAYLPYDGVVVDEAQDMGPQVMRLIRLLVPPGANDIFIVGDGHQRIYRRRYTLSACGIEVRGRSRKLKINYRTTEETRRFAVAVLEGEPIDDLDGGEDSTGDYRSLVHGVPPTVRGFSSQEEELDWLAERIRDLQEEGAEFKDICVVARTNALVDSYERGLGTRGFACIRLSRKLADNRAQEGVRLATMHRIKGLEFRHVMLAAVNDGVIPLRQAIENSEDPTERRAGELTERALFHVAVTRAMSRVFISYSGRGSEFLVGPRLRSL
jgi:hypothetical protein